METLNKKENQIVFKCGMDESLANAIRRHISEIPILAIDELELHKNDSPLYDETIAHRVGLIPLKMDKTYGDKTELKFKLSVNREGNVYSGDLEGGAEIVYSKIPITSLGKGQEIEFVASAKVGKGSQHSKFNPGLMFYRNVVEITIGKEFSEEIKKTFHNIEIKEKGDKLVILDDGKNEIADAIEGIANQKRKDAEIKKKDELIVSVESFGQLEVKEIFKQSIDAIKRDLKEVSKIVDKI